MKISSERAKEIDAYIVNHSDIEVGKWPIEIAGEKKILPFYRFPIKNLLLYNKNNGRLAMDVKEWEEKNGRKLDASDDDDAKVICNMLLELDKEKTKVLRDDIRKKGQMEPGVITHDGFVINGNRRMAVLEELHRQEPTGKWEFLEAVRLPAEISEAPPTGVGGFYLSKSSLI